MWVCTRAVTKNKKGKVENANASPFIGWTQGGSLRVVIRNKRNGNKLAKPRYATFTKKKKKNVA